MADYGITSSGFVAKPLATIIEELEDSWDTVFLEKSGVHADLSSDSINGQIIGIIAERESLIWELLEAVFNSSNPATVEGTIQDTLYAINLLTRKSATKSILEGLVLIGDEGTTVSAGTVFSVNDNTDYKYKTDEDVTLNAGTDDIWTMTFGAAPTGGSFKFQVGSEITTTIAYDASSSDIENTLNNLDLVDEAEVTISEDGLSYEINLGKIIAATFTIYSSTIAGAGTISIAHTQTGVYQAQVDCTAVTAGYQSAPALSVSFVDSPQTGLTRVFNPTDATEGGDIESDSNFRVRRKTTLYTGKSTPDTIRAAILSIDNVDDCFVCENDTNSVDSTGRPAHSVEVIVYQKNEADGDGQTIADAIYANAPAGIQKYGDETYTVTDSQGRDHSISFSRPEEVPIYLILTLTVNDDFPSDGVATVKENITEWGNDLGAGKSIIVYPKLVSIIGDVDGIEDMTIKIGKTSTPTTDDNISIGDGVSADVQISTWDTSNITITTVDA